MSLSSVQHDFRWLSLLFAVCEPPDIRHSFVHESGLADGVDGSRNFTAGSRIEVVCGTGYRFPHTKSTVLHIICHVNGSWTDLLGSDTIPSCQCKCFIFHHWPALVVFYYALPNCVSKKVLGC